MVAEGICLLQVRDYELDMQGIVNNSVYQNYFEHARHEYIKELGIDFAEFARKGINLVVSRIEIDYKNSLTSGDEFYIKSTMEKEGRLRVVFNQNIYRKTDDKVMVKAKVTAVALNEQGRPHMPDELVALFAD